MQALHENSREVFLTIYWCRKMVERYGTLNGAPIGAPTLVGWTRAVLQRGADWEFGTPIGAPTSVGWTRAALQRGARIYINFFN